MKCSNSFILRLLVSQFWSKLSYKITFHYQIHQSGPIDIFERFIRGKMSHNRCLMIFTSKYRRVNALPLFLFPTERGCQVFSSLREVLLAQWGIFQKFQPTYPCYLLHFPTFIEFVLLIQIEFSKNLSKC